MENADWKIRTTYEIKHAEAARLSGREGRARVCARRAAGHILGEYFRRLEIPFYTTSVYARLQFLESQSNLSPQVRAVISHFLVHVTPEYHLPIDADLVKEVRWLAEVLLGESL